MPICELVTFDSDKEMIVHFDRLENIDVEFEWIADTLGVPTTDVMAALFLPNNHRFTFCLFVWWYERLAGLIPGAVLEEDPNTIPPTVISRAPDIPMSPKGFSVHDEAYSALQTIHIHHYPFHLWPVPPEPLWLPRTPTVDGHLERLVVRGPARNRCVSITAPVFPSAAVEGLAVRIAKLEKLLAKRTKVVASWAEHRLALEYAGRILLLTRWQWTNAPRPYAAQDKALARVDELTRAIADLEEAADTTIPLVEDERDAARELLLFISPASTAAAEIAEALELIAAQPTAFRGEAINDLFDYLERAFLALSQSSLAEDFVAGHVVHLVRALFETVAPELEVAFADAADGDWPQLWATDWRSSLDALEAAGLGDKSPFAALAKIGKRFKTASALVLGAINQGTLPVILARLAIHSPSEREGFVLMRSLATGLLRGLLAHASLHRGADKEVLIGGKDMTAWFRACARALRKPPSAAELDEIADGLRTLKLGDAIGKSRVVGSVGFVFGVVSTLATAGDTWDRTWQSSTALVDGLLKRTADLSELAASFAAQREASARVDDLARMADQMSMLSTIVGFIVTTKDSIEGWAYLSKANKFAQTLSMLSATNALVRLLPVVKASAMWSRALGIVGVVLAIADALTGIVLSLRTADAQTLFDQYFDFALEGSPYEHVDTAVFDRVIAARKRSHEAKVFVDLRGPAGERGVVPHGGFPTWHFANGLGFPAEIVAKLFDEHIMDVVGAGIRLGPHYEEE